MEHRGLGQPVEDPVPRKSSLDRCLVLLLEGDESHDAVGADCHHVAATAAAATDATGLQRRNT